MNTIRLLFFATLKDRAGLSKTELDLPEGATVADLKSRVMERFPRVGDMLGHALIAVNQNYAFDEDPIPQGAEVAFFPPVSGGSEPHPPAPSPLHGEGGEENRFPGEENRFPGEEKSFPMILRVTEEVLDLDELVAQITLPSTGAAAIFTGMVRGVTTREGHGYGAHETVCLEYEAYVPMAEAKMAQVAEEIRQRWPTVEGIAIVQRIGRLAAGTPTVLIACTASHRDTGVFEAARYGIDRLKEIVPVWKKEIKPDGEEWIEGEYQPKRGD